MQSYPMAMRLRILADCDAGMNTQAVALKYQVSESWVRRLKQRRRESGEIAARKSGRRKPPKWHEHAEQIAAAAHEHPDATLAELLAYLKLDMSIATLDRALRALKITFKKKFCMPKNKTEKTLRHSAHNGKPR